VTKNWCKRFCLAQHPAKVRSVSKSIFTIPVIEDTIFFNHCLCHSKTSDFTPFCNISALHHAAKHSTTQR
jgi:hypothetical protein